APLVDNQDLGFYNVDQGTAANQCTNPPRGIWSELRTANAAFRTEVGMAASNFQPAGAYSTTPGTATAFLSSDVAALATQIQNSLDGLKSCVIELNFDVVNAELGEIFVHDTENPIPQDQWRMNDTYVLE